MILPIMSINPSDAIALLMADHTAIKALFEAYPALALQRDAHGPKAALVGRICDELSMHGRIEGEIFYPAVRKAIEEDGLLDEAIAGHAGADELIAQLRAMAPGDDLYDARVAVLAECIEHHVKEEEGTMFPRVRNSPIDTQGLGLQMWARRDELMSGPRESDADGFGPPRAWKANGWSPVLQPGAVIATS